MSDADQQVTDAALVAGAYKLHKTIESTHEKIQRVQDEIRKTNLAERFAFIGTLLVYFVFIWGLYVNELWGFYTWLEKNLTEVFALPIFAALGITLPLAMAYIKSIAYHHLALYDLKKATTYAIVIFLMIAGMTYEAISSSGQQQHIAHTSAESSKTFQALMGGNVTVGDTSALADKIAKAESKLARCKERLAAGKEKDCAQTTATVESLKSSMATSSEAAVQASTAAIEAKAKAASDMKEDSFKPVYKFARDVFGVTISTGVVMVAVLVSLIFEISHGLLVLFLMQKNRYLEFLKNSLIDQQADYMTGTGKVHALDDFTDTSILDMDKLRESGEIKRNGIGFGADIRPVTAYSTQHSRQTMADFEAARAQSRPFGLIPPTASRSQQGAPKPVSQPMGKAIYTGLSVAELMNLKLVAKNKKFGEIATCPACGVQFKKTNCGQVFCIKDHKNVFDSLVRKAQNIQSGA